MSRRLALSVTGVALLIASVLTLGVSGAFFQDTDSTSQPVSADQPNGWLHLYSQGSDPQGRTGYAPRANNAAVPAAVGTGSALRINAGRRRAAGAWPAFDRAFVLTAADPLPGGASSVQVTVSAENPVGHPTQPIQNLTLTALDGSPAANPATLSAGEERQVNFQLDTTGLAATTLYEPTIVVRLDFPDGSFLNYRVPVAVCTAVAPATC